MGGGSSTEPADRDSLLLYGFYVFKFTMYKMKMERDSYSDNIVFITK